MCCLNPRPSHSNTLEGWRVAWSGSLVLENLISVSPLPPLGQALLRRGRGEKRVGKKEECPWQEGICLDQTNSTGCWCHPSIWWFSANAGVVFMRWELGFTPDPPCWGPWEEEPHNPEISVRPFLSLRSRMGNNVALALAPFKGFHFTWRHKWRPRYCFTTYKYGTSAFSLKISLRFHPYPLIFF